MSLVLHVLSVNVATPKALGGGEQVLSAISKSPVRGASIAVGPLNIDGDAQADLENHGGSDKAVYAYPADHWNWWKTEHGLACAPGRFGENLTLCGGDETMVRIGDRFAWGDVIVEITQPRVPCFKLAHHTGRADIATRLMLCGRSGWYLRVLKPGRAPVEGGVMTRIGEGNGPTVREIFCAAFDPKTPQERREALAATPGLSDAWRKRLLPDPGR